MSLTGGQGAGAAITACSVHAVQEQAIDLLAPFGRVCFFGGLPKDKPTITLNSNAVHYKNLVVTGTTGGCPEDFRIAMALIATGRVDLTRLSSHTFPLDSLEEAYQKAMGGECMKVIIAA